jgi:formylglycine-generating enzyme required for sulfatase activity
LPTGFGLTWVGFWIALAVWFVAAVAVAQDRSALVVANYEYGEHQLATVKADADVVSEVLRREGFQVTAAENLAAKELKNTVEQFARSTTTRGTAVFYFVGLVGQYQTYNSKEAWWNHLQGAGKSIDPKNSEKESLALPEIVKAFAEHSACSTNLIVIDVAGPNPLIKGRANQPVGLAPVAASDLPSDLGVLLGTQPDSEVNESSQLASAFAKHIARGRESVGKWLDATVNDVKDKTGDKQQPTLVSGQPFVRASWNVAPARSVLEAGSPRDGERPCQQWANSTGMVFCWCPPGKFRMGNLDQTRAEFEDAEPVEVTLSNGFWMGKYEVTQQEAGRLKAGQNRYPFPGKNLPLHMIQQDQVKKLISALSEQERKAGRLPDDWEYALPTEAQWEYACRAGTTTRYSFGDDESLLCRHANYADKSLLAADDALQFADARFDDGVGRSLAVVGSYSPNAWGLHDMHGNVAEWCVDRYLPKLVGGTDPLVDEKNKAAAPAGIIRGGGWCSTARYCEAGFRNSEFAGGNSKNRDFIGVRLVLKKK